jgi:hypothetical protein
VKVGSLALSKEQVVRVTENKVLRIFAPKGEDVTGRWENCIMRSFTICTLLQIILG